MSTVESGRTGVETEKRTALIIATLNSFVTPFMGSSINIALPSIEKELHVDAVLLSWIATSYLLAVSVFLVPFGRFADIYGRKKIFASGVIVFTLASILCAVSTSTYGLLVFRVFQGIGNAMVFATGMAILVSVYPPQERGRVLGINVAAVYIGLSAGPFLGGILTHYSTWRSVFLVTVPIGLFILLLIFSRLKGEWADAAGEKFDVLGSIIYGAAIVSIVLGISMLPALKSLWTILASLLCFVAFFKYELRVTHPVFEVGLFKTNRVFAFSSVAALIHYSATFAVTFLLSLYLQHVKGLTPRSAGLVLVAQPIMMAIFSPFAGKLSDRIEPRIVATYGMSLTTIGLFLMTFLDNETSLVYIIGCLLLLGFGFALFSSPNTNAIMSSVEKRFFGIASGMVGTMRTLGMMVSMGIATVVFSILIGRVRISPKNYPLLMESITVVLTILSILCFVGIFLSMTRGDVRLKTDLGER
ncbi:MAG: MFS transporter [Desulfatiglans sp.]|jgi:EmrB/QacA subfamily drug resistance transporter|nr:MFS transporter [Desulfatiglans sp.]